MKPGNFPASPSPELAYLDSHGSNTTVMRIAMIYHQLHEARNMAQNNLDADSIYQYYTFIEDITLETCVIWGSTYRSTSESLRKAFNDLFWRVKVGVENGGVEYTIGNMNSLLGICKALDYNTRLALQAKGFLFRESAPEHKGLKALDFFEEASLFADRSKVKLKLEVKDGKPTKG